jgi:putative hydroxymethylpyrimidine transport system permease protein
MRMGVMVMIVLAVWQGAISRFALPAYILPSPQAVLNAFYVYGAVILDNVWPTLFETVMGFVLGSLLGMLVAIFLAYVKLARLWFLPLVLVSQALPTFAIAPLLVIWLGYGEASKIVVCILMLFFPVTSAFYDGLIRTPAGYMDLAKTMNASPWRALWHVRVPYALPTLASGLRVAATFAPMGAIIGEWVGASRGLGFLMLNANSRMQIDMMFAVILVVIILTLVFYFMVDRILRRMIFWERSNHV